MGATTFWETFAVAPEVISNNVPWWSGNYSHGPTLVPWTWSGITSLCHPWSAGPTYWISQNLLGVKPTEPGFRTFEISPQLTKSLHRVRGKVQTVLGSFDVFFDAIEGVGEVTIPAGVQVGRVVLPILEQHTMRWVKINNVHVVISESLIIGPGLHKFQWGYDLKKAEINSPPFPKPKYRAKFLRKDETTGGRWISRYGSLGYYLFAFGSNLTSISKFPSFVSSIKNAYNRGHFNQFGAPDPQDDRRALDDPSYPTRRSIGRLSQAVIVAVDIITSSNEPYQLSAYFVDWENQGRIESVTLLNASDSRFDVIAPLQMLENFSDGCYLVWQVRGSVRVRIAHVGGDPGGQDAVISGLFFDDYKESRMRATD